MAEYSKSTIARLWSKIDRRGPDECWEWTGATEYRGYGRVKIGGKLMQPYRVVYEIENGPIPKGEGYHGTCVRHRCDNPRCCNPAHLELGSHRDNVVDMHMRGRVGASFPRVSDDVVRAALEAEGSFRKIAAELGIAHQTVARIKRGKRVVQFAET